jgi:hypothetical protein
MKRVWMAMIIGAFATACGRGGATESEAGEQTSGQEQEATLSGGARYDALVLSEVPEAERVAVCEHLEGQRPGPRVCEDGSTDSRHSQESCVRMLTTVAGQAECTSTGADYTRCAQVLDVIDTCTAPPEEEREALESEACAALVPCMVLALQVRFESQE